MAPSASAALATTRRSCAMAPSASAALAALVAAALASPPCVLAQGTRALSSANLTLGVSVLPSGSVVVTNFSFFGAGAQTINLALPVAPTGAKTGGGTLLVAAGAGGGQGAIVPACVPAASCTLSSTPTTVAVAGIQLPGLEGVVEDWAFSLTNDTSVSWTVTRRWPAGRAPLAVNRLGLSLATTGGLPVHSQQIPSYLDLDMFLNESSTGGFDIRNGAFEFLSPNARQVVRFSPTGALAVIEGSALLNGSPAPVFWSFAKPFADGTTWASIGFEAVDPRAPLSGAAAGTTASSSSTSSFSSSPSPSSSPAAPDTEVLTFTLNMLASDAPTPAGVENPWPAVDASFPSPALAAQVATLTAVQYQLNGWLFGNNPASVPCLHEMAWWPLITGTFPAGSPALAAMQKQLGFFARCGWQPGVWPGDYAWESTCNLTLGAAFGLTQRYSAEGYYSCPWGPLQDQNVMFPVAVYFTYVATGDVSWLQSMLPALRAMDAYLSSRGLSLPGGPSSPVVFTSPASGVADGGRHASNWYDIILFGHFDAFLAVHGVWAMQCLAELYAAAGDGPASARAAAVHAAASADFNALFWNSSSASYHDWIDAAGNARSYFYTDIAFTAIVAGVASPAQTSGLLSHYDARLAEIVAGYNVTPGGIWSPPCSLYPITNPKEYATTNQKEAFPGYENGGSFFHTSGLQFAALGVAGRADEAYQGFAALMSSGFGDSRGWAQQLYWGSVDTLVGFDPLNTALLAVWGLLRSGFGVAPSVAAPGGLRVVNAPPAAMEGARWNMSVLGQSVCLVVAGGSTTFCNGSVIGGGSGGGGGGR